MADARPPTSPAAQAPQVHQQPLQTVQPHVPDHPITAQQVQHIPQINWSHFRPEFSGEPEEDAEAHLLRMNDWMDTHAFPEVLRFIILPYINRRS